MAILILPPKQTIITVDVFYYFPDHPLLIQEFMWQTEDVVPEMPRIRKFLTYWQNNIDGLIKEVVLFGLNPNGDPCRFQTVDEIFSL